MPPVRRVLLKKLQLQFLASPVGTSNCNCNVGDTALVIYSNMETIQLYLCPMHLGTVKCFILHTKIAMTILISFNGVVGLERLGRLISCHHVVESGSN